MILGQLTLKDTNFQSFYRSLKLFILRSSISTANPWKIHKIFCLKNCWQSLKFKFYVLKIKSPYDTYHSWPLLNIILLSLHAHTATHSYLIEFSKCLLLLVSIMVFVSVVELAKPVYTLFIKNLCPSSGQWIWMKYHYYPTFKCVPIPELCKVFIMLRHQSINLQRKLCTVMCSLVMILPCDVIIVYFAFNVWIVMLKHIMTATILLMDKNFEVSQILTYPWKWKPFKLSISKRVCTTAKLYYGFCDISQY